MSKNKMRVGATGSRLFLCVIFLLCNIFLSAVQAESFDNVALLKAPIDLSNIPSLQRGAKFYINYCSGCHSLSFMRYNRIGQDLQIDAAMVKENFIFTGARITDTLQIAMPKDEAKNWFGVTPPDLSVEARARGVDWLYTYLLSFYQDNARPWGVNNLVFNETAMPDVLANLRGKQVPVYVTKQIFMDNKAQLIHVIDHLVLVDPGSMSQEQFESAVADIVNFLAYVAEPAKLQRERIGIWVVEFLILFAVLAYLLKRAYWKNLK